MNKYWVLSLLTFLSCSTEKKQTQSALTSNLPEEITVIFNSEGSEPLHITTPLTAEEIKENLVSDQNVNPNDTMKLALREKHQIIYMLYQFPEEYSIIVSAGDTIVVDANSDAGKISKLVKGKKHIINDIHQDVFDETPQRKTIEELFKKTRELKGDNKSEGIKSYIEASNKYYDNVRDSFLKADDYKARILADLVLVEQYIKLSGLNNKLRDTSLSKLLSSEKFISVANLNNRSLKPIFNFYNINNVISNPTKRTLAERYATDFEQFPSEIQEYFKYITIVQMVAQKYDRKTTIKYINAFKEDYGSNRGLEALMKNIEYTAVETDELKLIDETNGKETWSNLMKKWRGKVIYVDFWASWCSPCIAELPHSKKLSKEQKDVVFVYLALNDEETAWRRAIEKHQLKKHSYLITNSKSSNFISKYEINSIPRYMIIDKDGIINNPDAPRPSSTEINYLFTNLLKK
ncbi:TlpA family protein disulfide reductase [Emticicia soli]|uniref:TlpA family protein disulfide reductase n=1 Tax=Emticicia soli TaxID=2027878 RepID=A0ABW5J6H3_9BACT